MFCFNGPIKGKTPLPVLVYNQITYSPMQVEKCCPQIQKRHSFGSFKTNSLNLSMKLSENILAITFSNDMRNTYAILL